MPFGTSTALYHEFFLRRWDWKWENNIEYADYFIIIIYYHTIIRSYFSVMTDNWSNMKVLWLIWLSLRLLSHCPGLKSRTSWISVVVFACLTADLSFAQDKVWKQIWNKVSLQMKWGRNDNTKQEILEMSHTSRISDTKTTPLADQWTYLFNYEQTKRSQRP